MILDLIRMCPGPAEMVSIASFLTGMDWIPSGLLPVAWFDRGVAPCFGVGGLVILLKIGLVGRGSFLVPGFPGDLDNCFADWTLMASGVDSNVLCCRQTHSLTGMVASSVVIVTLIYRLDRAGRVAVR